MTNKRKIQRARRAQNTTILQNKRVKYLDAQITSYVKKEVLLYDPCAGLMFKADLEKIRKLGDIVASLGWIDEWSLLDLMNNC